MVLRYCFAFLKHGSLWTYRLATAAILLAGAAFVVLVLGLRYYVLPHADDYRGAIEDAISRASGHRVTIGIVEGSWQGYRPELNFSQVQVFDVQGQPAFQLDRVEAVLAWLSLFSADLRFESIGVFGPRVEVMRDASGTVRVGGIAMGKGAADGGGLGDWLLAQRQILVRDATIVWNDEARQAPELRIEKVDFRLDNAGSVHEFGLSGQLPAAVASQISVRGELHGLRTADLQGWTGRIYAEIPQVSLALAQMWVDAPLALSSGIGSLRLWLDLAGTRITAATADLSLANVRGRIEPELPEFGLLGLSGRLTWKEQGDRREMAATSLAFTTEDGLALAPMNFVLARSGDPQSAERRTELRVERLDLAPVARMAGFLPLEPALRERLALAAPSGMVDAGEFSWAGAFDRSRPYHARVTFRDVTLRPDGALPGVRKLGGEVDASEQGGTANLSMTEGSLDLPRIFSEPVPVEVLSAGLGWRFQDGQTWLTLRNASFTNEHAAGSIHGSYRTEASGPGVIDMSGTLIRANARDVWRYIPLAAPITRAWTREALLGGESRDTRFRLKGRLADFPFEDPKKGFFEVVSKVSGGTLEYAKGWPLMTGVTGEVTFRARHMEVVSPSAAILGTRLSDVKISLDDLGLHNEHLIVKGQADGPTAEFLRYVAESPVAGQINRFTEEIRARGDAKLRLDLDLALHRMQESIVSGEFVLRDNKVTIDPRLPELDQFGARIHFSRDARRAALSVKEGRALLLGNPVEFEGSNQADGAVTVKLGGSLEAARLADLTAYAPLRFLDGRFAWTGNVSVRNKIATVRFDSDLAGLSSRLPAPLAKAAEARLPLRIELRERPGRQGMLAISLGSVMAAQLAIDGGVDGIRRGTIGFGVPAVLGDGDGLVIKGKLEQLDLDAWNGVLKGSARGGPAPPIASVDLDIENLEFSRRHFNDLSIDVTARRDTWQGTVDGEEIAGQVSWTSEGQGRLMARLTRLVLPAPASNVVPPQPVAGETLPSLDVIAENFRFEGKDLGRLVVRASPDPQGWTLEHLEAVNPDGKLAVNGRWNTDGEQRTDVNVRLDAVDIGRYFTRMGYPDGIKGGRGSVEGPIAWAGSPTRLDIRTLSGRLKLEAKDGRFQQVNPGVGKLLGIVSLQALPKRLSFDFDDIFRKGFTFDEISANLQIASGIAQTSDFLMKGSAAKVGMHGTVDLGAETQNLTLRVTPSLSESIAVAGAIVNPAVGVAALIAQKALKDPFSSIASYEYAVTGTWTDPVLKRLSRGAEGVQQRGR